MSSIELPYGKNHVLLEISDERLQAVLVSELHHYTPNESQVELVKNAIENPIGSKRLCELAKGKNKIVIIASDHTRPVPSKVIMPLMLREIRKENPDADITILIATGCHRGTTKDELVVKFGEEIVKNEKICIHDCDDESMFIKLGILPSGGELIINKLAYEADLLVSEGFIEPHFFAGYSGGRKSVLPGIASRQTVLANHCSEFIADPKSRCGILEGNPIHKDMLWAARKAKLSFIVNVVINAEKKVIYAVAGDLEAAHDKGCQFLSNLCMVKAVPADIAITTNGGYPLDQNIYQSVKGMTAAEATVKQGGVIIMISKSNDGHGGEEFYRTFKEASNLQDVMNTFLSRNRNETEADQWESQILIRVLQKARVIYVSESDEQTITDFHMIPAKNIEEALVKAEFILGNDKSTVTVIPDGVSVMVLE